MVSLCIKLTDEQNIQLREYHKETGFGIAEILRRAFDEFMLQKRKEKFYNPIKNEEG